MVSSVLDIEVFNPTPDYKENAFSVRDLCSGVQVFGGTGSGKTSGSGQTIAYNFLKLKKDLKGLGGLVLTAKPDEVTEWKELLKSANVPDEDVVIFGKNQGSIFNFLDYEFTRGDDGSDKVLNIIKALKITAEMSQSDDDSSKNNNDSYWYANASIVLKHIIALYSLAGKSISPETIDEAFSSIPQDSAKAQELRRKEALIVKNIEQLYKNNKELTPELAQEEERYLDELTPIKRLYYIILHCYNVGLSSDEAMISGVEMAQAELAYKYLYDEYPKISDKTRSSIDVTARLMYYPFLQGSLKELFSGKSTVTPDDILDGKIVILDMAILRYGEMGRIGQAIWKYFFQKVIESREIKEDTPPVFIWADESQYFINEHDQLFLTTSRSQRCMTVYLTQNVENYIAKIGEHLTYAMLGNFQTKIFHQNSDIKTNEYASKVIGKRWQEQSSYTVGESIQSNQSSTTSSSSSDSGSGSSSGNSSSSSYSSGVSYSSSETVNQIHEYLVQPYMFNVLKNGSPANNYIVEGYIYKSGREFIINKEIFISKYLVRKQKRHELNYTEITAKIEFNQKIQNEVVESEEVN